MAECIGIEWFPVTDSTDPGTVVFDNCEWMNGTAAIATQNGFDHYHITLKGGKVHSTVTGDTFVRRSQYIEVRPKTMTIDGTTFDNPGYWVRNEGRAAETLRVSGVSITNPASLGAYLHSPTVVWLHQPTFENGGQVVLAVGGAPAYKGTRAILT